MWQWPILRFYMRRILYSIDANDYFKVLRSILNYTVMVVNTKVWNICQVSKLKELKADLFSAPAFFANFIKGLHKKVGDHSGRLVFSGHRPKLTRPFFGRPRDPK